VVIVIIIIIIILPQLFVGEEVNALELAFRRGNAPEFVFLRVL
jgi:hypothetical protein